MIDVSNDSSVPTCSKEKGISQIRLKPNNIWSNQKSWRKNGANISYPNRNFINYSDGDLKTIERKTEHRHSTIRKIVRTAGRLKINVLDIDSYLKSFQQNPLK